MEARPPPIGLPVSDEETLALARGYVTEMAERLGNTYTFYMAAEGGIQALEIDGSLRYFIRNWAVLRILIETLEEMDPQFPPPADDLDGVKIPD